MLLAAFEPAIPATKRPQNYTLDRAASGISIVHMDTVIFYDVLACNTLVFEAFTVVGH
jgi:hypothetical protein